MLERQQRESKLLLSDANSPRGDWKTLRSRLKHEETILLTKFFLVKSVLPTYLRNAQPTTTVLKFEAIAEIEWYVFLM